MATPAWHWLGGILVLGWATSVAAVTLDYSNGCSAVALGPITVLDTLAPPTTGTVDLTPNVPLLTSIVNSGGIRRMDDTSVASGTFVGTLSCTLVLGGVSVPYSRSLTLDITPPSAMNGGHAEGILTTGAVTVDVDLGAARGTAMVAAEAFLSAGYDASLVQGGVIVVPGLIGDTAVLQCDVASGCREICDDCVDDNGDGLVDHDDPECQARADGGGAGLGPPKPVGKAIVKCENTLQGAGARFAAAHIRHLRQCLGAAFACVQRKPNDAGCLTKAGAGCAKQLGTLAKDRAKLTAAIGKACPATAVDMAALLTDPGLGFESETERCAAAGVPTLATSADVAACVADLHRCDAEAAVGFDTPRAGELLTLVGGNVATDAPCLPPTSGSSGFGISDAARAKAAVKCAQAVAKAGSIFVGKDQNLVRKCTSAVMACVQQKPGDAGCLTKARTRCTKTVGAIAAPGHGLEAKLAAAVQKRCGSLTPDDLTGFAGLGFGDRASACTALGGSALATAADVSACLVRQHECRAEQLLENEAPRLHELLGLAHATLP